MTIERLPRQLIPVRYVHFETPNSYLRRLCTANSIDHAWMLSLVKKRRVAARSGAAELGSVIAELGGPDSAMFVRAHQRALRGHPNTRGPWDKQAASRGACLSCTAGQRVVTFPHIRFMFCKRHGRWLGDVQRRSVLDADLWKAERRLRGLASTGRVDRELYETAWELVRDHYYLMDTDTRPRRLQHAQEQDSFILGTDDRVALFPETVRLIDTINRVAAATDGPGSRLTPSEHPARAKLSTALEWAGRERWLLVEGAYTILPLQRTR